MEVPRFNTQWNDHVDLSKTFFKPSLTVPDETLTPRQILEKYTRGEPVDVNVYSQEYDVLDSDLTDVFPSVDEHVQQVFPQETDTGVSSDSERSVENDVTPSEVS